eukprot:1189382-Prorocentrum_minimum.AAC.3
MRSFIRLFVKNELVRRGKTARKTDSRVMLAGPQGRAVGESREQHTGREEGKGLWGVESTLAVIGTGGPAVKYTGSCTSAMPQSQGFHSPRTGAVLPVARDALARVHFARRSDKATGDVLRDELLHPLQATTPLPLRRHGGGWAPALHSLPLSLRIPVPFRHQRRRHLDGFAPMPPNRIS